MICEFYNNKNKVNTIQVESHEIIEQIAKARAVARKEILKTEKEHVLFAITLYSEEDYPKKTMIFHNKCLSDEKLDYMVKKYPNARFEVLHKGTHYRACKMIVEKISKREIRPITLKTANIFVNQHHRHHQGTVGCKFAVGLFEAEQLIGVAICGRPVSRYLDNGLTCEINRLCTIGDSNACSQLYGACARIAQAMGYHKIITYILESESGISLKASNFTCEGKAGGTHWTGIRNKGQDFPHEMKTRWVRNLSNG